MPAKGSGKIREENVLKYCDGLKSSREIAEITGENQKYIQHVMKKYDTPRLPRGGPVKERNGSYKHGRRIDRDGYVLVSAPLGHPYARKRKNRNYGLIYEHRLVFESLIGRYLLPTEIVDHIDGLRLHNHPSNLRLFDSNGDHLRQTISGQIPKWSAEGYEKLQTKKSLLEGLPRIHKYNQKKKNGDARLQQILLSALQLGIDSPYLLGTHHHLKKAGIFDFSDSNLRHELALLCQRYA